MEKPVVFISYSHKDESWKNKLVTHLGVLQQEGLLDIWDDRRIGTGENWYQEIQKAIRDASVAILLISADFLTSKFIYSEEVQHLLKRRKNEGLHIFPIIIRPCVWKQVRWLSEMNLRPKDGRPISSGKKHQVDTDMAAIADEVANIIQKTSERECFSVSPENNKKFENTHEQETRESTISRNELLDFSKAQVRNEMDHIKGTNEERGNKKYLPSLYVPRREYENVFDDFVNSSFYGCAVIGEAGIGKTNLLCNLAERCLKNKIPTLFYDSHYISESISERIESDFFNYFNKKLSYLEIIKIFEDYFEASNHLIIFIDAINENISPQKLKNELANIIPSHVIEKESEDSFNLYKSKKSYLFCWDDIPENNSNKLIEFLIKIFSIDWVKTAKIEKIDDGKTIRVINGDNYLSLRLNDRKTKVVLLIDDGRTDEFIVRFENNKLNIYKKSKNIKYFISCRDIDWEFFITNNEKFLNKLYPKTYWGEKGIKLKKFDAYELESSFEKYKLTYNLKGELSENLRKILSHPLMLRFLSEAYENDYIPKDVRRLQIFDKYWFKKLENTGKKEIAMQHIFTIVSELKKNYEVEIPKKQVSYLLNETTDALETTLSKILSENLIIYTRINKFGDRVIGFTYEAFFEYVIARYILSGKDYYWEGKEINHILEDFTKLILEIKSFRTMRGVIQYLILLMEDKFNDIYIEMIEILIEKTCPQEENFIAETILKLSKIKNVKNVIQILSEKESQKKYIAGLAYSVMAEEKPEEVSISFVENFINENIYINYDKNLACICTKILERLADSRPNDIPFNLLIKLTRNNICPEGIAKTFERLIDKNLDFLQVWYDPYFREHCSNIGYKLFSNFACTKADKIPGDFWVNLMKEEKYSNVFETALIELSTKKPENIPFEFWLKLYRKGRSGRFYTYRAFGKLSRCNPGSVPIEKWKQLSNSSDEYFRAAGVKALKLLGEKRF